ncbi:MAG TPA: ParB/RepB/Spo0J family partition protein [Bacteroidales bacterium]|nr:ParB/RepB/Spo0J family partition protein [Bacteroidales bacterium]HPS62345.1 ParB/RepB/Spo0J family partition protein [Bacteroidales bacterium]
MSDSHPKKKALGRGLSALLESPESAGHIRELPEEYTAEHVAQVRVDQIEPNPFQPRIHFDEKELLELSGSIQAHGIIQPLTVRRIDANRYQLISGERRLKASIRAGLIQVPAYIRLANDEQMLEMALVENIQREDLNPLEIAISFQRLLEECQISQEDLSRKVGKDRSTVANYIRLLKLPTEIQVAVRDNLITMGHARALINVTDEQSQLVILKKILEKKLSVREVEEAVRNLGKKGTAGNQKTELPPKYEVAKLKLGDRLHSGVDIRLNRKGSGSLIIDFRSPDDFDRIMSKLES